MYLNDTGGLLHKFGTENKVDEWNLFIDSSKWRLKTLNEQATVYISKNQTLDLILIKTT